MSDKSSHAPVLGLVAIFLALASVLYLDKQPGKNRVIVQYPPRPCSSFDKVYAKYKVKDIGTFCIEKKTKDWIKSILKKNEVWEPHVSKLIKQYARKGSTAIDIGAYIGSHTIQMARAVGPKGRVVAFEPQVKIYQELLVNLQLNQITNAQTHFLALGTRPRRITMSYPNAKNEGGIDFGPGGNIVEIRTLDSFNYNNVSLMKIDVEGAENYVLAGAKKTIQRNRPFILIELVGGVRRNQMSPRDRQKLLRSMMYFKSLKYALAQIGEYDYLAMPRESAEYKRQQALRKKTPARQTPKVRKAPKTAAPTSRPAK